MKHYDQTKQELTKYSCTIYTMLNIIKFDFGIEVKDSTIFNIVAYMEKIGALMPTGAYFAVIYPAMTKLIELKTGLKLRVKKSSILEGLDEKSMWGLGVKKSTLIFTKDGVLSKKDVQDMAKVKKTFGHNFAIKKGKKSGKWVIIDSWKGRTYETTMSALKEGVRLGVFFNNARTLVPGDLRTSRIRKKSIERVKKNKKFNTYKG